jgi:hypothetical protein
MLQSISAKLSRALDQLIDALLDPQRAERRVLALLGAYVAVWSLYGTIAKSSQDIHFDMGEAVVWSHEALAGPPTHPPMSAWLARLWFCIFPQTDAAYYLLGITLAAVGLWAAWKVSAYFLSAEKRIAGLALLTLVPFCNFHALKFNANLAMLPFWALTTWAFLRAFQSRHVLPSILAGLAAAGAMLSKYWSVLLLAGLSIAVLADPRRRDFLRSRAPWIIAAVGFAALAPHIVWLFNHPSTFSHALNSHPGTTWTALWSGVRYVVGALSFAAVPALIAFVAARPSRAALADTVWPDDPDRRFAVVAFVAPIVLPIGIAAATSSIAVSLWSIAGMTLLPAVLLSSPLVGLSRVALRRILGVAIAVPFIALMASPIVALVIHRKGVDNYADNYRQVAQMVEQAWRNASTAPLGIFGSYNNLLYGSSFYFGAAPKTLEIVTPTRTPWTVDADVEKLGMAMVCPEAETVCMTALNMRAARAGVRATRKTVELARSFLGFSGRPNRYVIVVIPPL